MFYSHIKLYGIFLLAALCLSSCGGERTTPYNPGSSSASSSAVSVTVQAITQATTVNSLLDYSDKRLQILDEDDYYVVSNGYVNFNLENQDFDNGQVVLLDLGEQDSCKQRLDFNSLTAQEVGDDSVKVVITYRERAATSGTCTSVLSRPFYLYYVQSRGTLIFEESVL